LWVTGAVWARTFWIMDDQNEAWRRLTDARLKTLEAAIRPARIRRLADGRPQPPPAYEPGDMRPLTKWLELRLFAIELVIQLVLQADDARSDEEGVTPLEASVSAWLGEMARWSDRQFEPDLGTRVMMAMIEEARVILLETHTWPLAEQKAGV
jgi:hypothetical protein